MADIKNPEQLVVQHGAGGIVAPVKKKSRSSREDAASKRRCVSTACIACRKRKSKCNGNTPSCAACSSVYGTVCVYDPNSDHRRKGVYKEKIDSLKTRTSTLQTLVQAILNAAEDDVPDLVKQIRTCESLDEVADSIRRHEEGMDEDDGEIDGPSYTTNLPTFETQLSGKMGELRLENGAVRFLGGTSNLIYLEPTDEDEHAAASESFQQQEDPLTSWTAVTSDTEFIVHLINMYFTWHYPYFTTLSKSLFYRDFLLGKATINPKRTLYCSSPLVNAMLALGCHFTDSPKGCAHPGDTTTKGDAFFAEAKRLIVENDEYEKPSLTTIQALCLMSVREAGCGREAKGWVYSGMAFRLAQDMGLSLDSGGMTNSRESMDEQEIDARRVTFWGCFLFDKCWSNYLGRLPQLPAANITVAKYDVFPDEDADIWSPYTDNGIGQSHSQASRTRTVALQISSLAEISSDLLIFFYSPQRLERSIGRSQELKKLSELQTRLEAWRRDLPKELEPKEGQLPNVLLMHMFFHLLYIHLFRPFLKYSPSTSPLPSHVSPRKLCTQAAGSVSKLMRLYKRTYGLRQICNIAVYIVHSACTIHLLNLPEKAAKRDIIHGVKHLEEIADDWLCARRTLSILSVLARKWKIELPEEAAVVLARSDAKFGHFNTADVPSPKQEIIGSSPSSTATPPPFAPPPLPPQQGSNLVLNHNPLKHSLYSYPESQMLSTMKGMHHSPSDTQSPTIQALSARRQAASNGLAATNVGDDSSIPPVPFPRNPYSNLPTSASTSRSTLTPSTDILPTTSSMVSNSPAAMARQVTTNTMFGGVEALVESQDWWLRDQASLVIGFDNWMGPGGSDGMGNGAIASPNMNNLPNVDSSYLMPQNGNNGNNGNNPHNPDAFNDDDWNY
ncbi:putative pathway-specific regulatory protein nit-4 [Venustampulla echinocandica]|uniref:Putative pathway-specific regulatory protein nit-4 n=1 Tax=Venustampulla echinocandica TaxID=2656787 RepID=A0A370TA71_9HELO|nr:putative pathway-specific regulatory protein nit-4 [Venustampulla echinocandica]RDL30708.1 putative pathway-specific regulatory protein nit-4 [Venustampulla echinocandica]